MGLGFNVADEFVGMLFNYDRRGFWLSRIKKVLKNWEKKGLKWVNNDLKITRAGNGRERYKLFVIHQYNSLLMSCY